MGQFGSLSPGNHVFAPQEGGEVARKTGLEFGGGGPDEIEQAQFGGEIGQQGRHSAAVPRFEGGLGVGAEEVEFGVGDSACGFLARDEGGDQIAVRRLGGGGLGGGSGGGNGQEDFVERRRARPPDPPAGENRPGMARESGAGGEGAEKAAVDFAKLRAEFFEGVGRHQEKTTVRFL